MEWLKNILTGKDGATHDIARHSWMWSIVATFAGGTWNALHAGLFDLMTFAQAVGVIVAAHGAAIFAKKDTEPTDAAPRS